MSKINLHTIFCHLVDDPTFLSVVVDCSNTHKKTTEKKSNTISNFNIMTDMISDYSQLQVAEIQKYILFPSEFRHFLTPDYVRCGIQSRIEKNMITINMSFLNSINVLLRPNVFSYNSLDQQKNYLLFENFIVHKINGNCKIDKTKNTRKMQTVNKEIVKNLVSGKIQPNVIQTIINIFEINLLVFDFMKKEIMFYWSCGDKYPHLNLFNDLYCMAHIHDNYEPIMTLDKTIPDEHIRKMYVDILVNYKDIIQYNIPINMFIHSLCVLNEWNIPHDKYMTILESYFTQKK